MIAYFPEEKFLLIDAGLNSCISEVFTKEIVLVKKEEKYLKICVHINTTACSVCTMYQVLC
jgi:hypothetical protein